MAPSARTLFLAATLAFASSSFGQKLPDDITTMGGGKKPKITTGITWDSVRDEDEDVSVYTPRPEAVDVCRAQASSKGRHGSSVHALQ
jgi:hypothetical protein